MLRIIDVQETNLYGASANLNNNQLRELNSYQEWGWNNAYVHPAGSGGSA
jgi:hypothetical protein